MNRTETMNSSPETIELCDITRLNEIRHSKQLCDISGRNRCFRARTSHSSFPRLPRTFALKIKGISKILDNRIIQTVLQSN